jgi:hypothetical protein
MNQIITVSRSTFNEIRRKIDEVFGYLVKEDAEIDMEGVSLKAEEETPHQLRIAKDETSSR